MKSLKTFLLIDDDADDRNLFRIALKEVDASLKFREADDGESALSQLRKAGSLLPDIILLDLNMPGIGGRDVLKELKKDKRLKNIPVVIYSTSSAKKDINETLALGASSYLVKPFQFDGITEAITDLISKNWNDAEFHLLEF